MGFATEGARALIDAGFRYRGVQSIVADTVVEHEASRRVLENLGFGPIAKKQPTLGDRLSCIGSGRNPPSAHRVDFLVGHGARDDGDGNRELSRRLQHGRNQGSRTFLAVAGRGQNENGDILFLDDVH